MTKAQHTITASEIDLAKMAAYIDGEGCIGISCRREETTQWWHLHLNISNSDPRLIEWVQQRFGKGSVSIQKHGKRGQSKAVYNWLARDSQVAEILQLCLPYFTIKRDQAEIALAFRRTFFSQSGKRYHRWNRLTSDVIEQRRVLQANLSQTKHFGVVQ